MSKVKFLTTVDNPFDPDTQFDEWQAFDLEKGYNTLERMAALVQQAKEVSNVDTLTDDEYFQAAAELMYEHNITGKYKFVEIEDENDDSREENEVPGGGVA